MSAHAGGLAPRRRTGLLLGWALLLCHAAGCRGAQSADIADFYPVQAAPAASGTPVDFGFLNAPLREGDRLQACGEALCTRDGQRPVRLFGVNLGFEAGLPDEAGGERLVADLRALGVNLVRLHALDAIASAGKADGLLSAAPFPSLDPDAVARLRRLLQRCRDNGIYVDLNLHVGYAFRPAIDGTSPLLDDTPWPDHAKPMLRIDPHAVQLQARYAQVLLAALRDAAGAALAIVEIDNESSLVYAWMDGSLERNVRGPLRQRLLAAWAGWARTHALPAQAGAELPRLDGGDDAPAAAFLDLLVEQDRRYHARIGAAIAGAAPGVLTIGTQMNFGGLANLRSLASMDLRDSHFYVDHYRFPGRAWQWDDWRIGDASGLRDGLAPLLGAAFYRVFGTPYLVTEFNQPWPNRHAAELLPETALLAGLQGWSGLAYYDYAHRRGEATPTVPYEFSLVGDPGRRAQFGQMAWLFRTQAIAPLRAASGYTPGPDLQLRAARGRVTGLLGDFLQVQGIIATPASAFRQRVGIGSAAPLDASPAHAGVAFDPQAGLLRLAVAQAAGIVGRLLPGVRYDSGPLTLEMAPAAGEGTTALMLSSLDGRPLQASARLLLTLPGYTLGSDAQGLPLPPTPASWLDRAGTATGLASPAYTLRDPQSGQGVDLRRIRAPIWMRRQPCVLRLRLPARQLAVYPLDAAGHRLDPLDASAVVATADGFELHLQSPGQPAAPWYELSLAP